MGLYEQHYLKHYGVKGMKWGVRRYQNEDGTLTAAGKERYYSDGEQRSMYEHAKKSVSFTNGNTVKDIDDVSQAAAFLKKQSHIVDNDAAEFLKSYEQDLEGLKSNDEFKSVVKRRLNEEFGSADMVDDDEYARLVAEDIVLENKNQYLSKRTKDAFTKMENSADQYRSNLKDVADDIVGRYGDQPVTSIRKGPGLFGKSLKVTSSYIEAISNTLYDEGGGWAIRHILKGDIAAYANYDSIVDTIMREWNSSK